MDTIYEAMIFKRGENDHPLGPCPATTIPRLLGLLLPSPIMSTKRWHFLPLLLLQSQSWAVLLQVLAGSSQKCSRGPWSLLATSKGIKDEQWASLLIQDLGTYLISEQGFTLVCCLVLSARLPESLVWAACTLATAHQNLFPRQEATRDLE